MKRLTIFTSYAVLIVFAFIVTCKVFDSRFAEVTIDYFAFFAGIFLVGEGIYKIPKARARGISEVVLTTVTIIIGTCIFTIHLLQFMRY